MSSAHVGGDVGDLLLRERVLEGGHPTAAVRDLCLHLDLVGRVRVLGEARAAVAARAGETVAAGAVVGPHGLARSGVPARGLGGRLAGVAGSLALAACSDLVHRAVE